MNLQNSVTSNISIKKTKKTCSFCGGNHVISQCNIKSNLGKEWSGIELRKYLLLDAPYSILDHQDMNSIINDDIDCSRMSQHIKVHLLHSKTHPSLLNNPSENDMATTVTLYQKDGYPILGLERCIVSLNVLLAYILKHQSNSKRFFSVESKMKALVLHFIQGHHHQICLKIHMGHLVQSRVHLNT